MPRGRPRTTAATDTRLDGQEPLPGLPSLLTIEDLATPPQPDVPVTQVWLATLSGYEVGAPPDKALVESIKRHGILNPISVVAAIGSLHDPLYLVWDGRRRTQAAKLLGLDVLPARIYPETNHMTALLGLVMNGHRRPNPWAEWLAIKTLLDAGAGMAVIAQATKLPIGTIKRRAKLGNLIPEMAGRVSHGLISAVVAEAIASLSYSYQKRLLPIVAERGKLTMADVRGVVKVRASEGAEQYLPTEMFTEQGNDTAERYERVYAALCAAVGSDVAEQIARGREEYREVDPEVNEMDGAD